MRKAFAVWSLAMGLAGFLGMNAAVAAEEKEDKDVVVPLDQVPDAVKKAATDAVKGLVLTKAEKEVKNGKTIYELEGKVGDKEYEIKVSADGKEIKVKVEDDKDEKGEGHKGK